MKITFLGTSHGAPTADRFCSCTMLEVNGAIYFIDAGAPMTEALLQRGITANNVKAVFTTHAHADHVGCLFPFLSLTNWYYRESSIAYHVTEQFFGDALKAMVLATDGVTLSNRHEIRVVDKDYVYKDENINVSFFPTRHIDNQGRPAYSILVEAEGKKVFFSGDLKPHLLDSDFPVYVRENDVDVFICELAHFTVDEVKPYLEQTHTKALYFNHVYPLDKFEKATALNGTLPYPVYLPKDNDVIKL